MGRQFNIFDLRLLPYLLVNDGIVVETGYNFLDMTGYSKADILHKPVEDILYKLLKIHFAVQDLENIQEEKDVYLFTKFCQVKEVTLVVQHGLGKNEMVLVLAEKYNSRLEDKLPFIQQLYLDNVFGVAVFSAPEFILLKATQQYLNILDEGYRNIENVIGLPISQFINGWSGSSAEQIWKDVLQTGKTIHLNEFMWDKFNRGETYWEFTLTPISEEGNIKYIIILLNDVTERVLGKKCIEEQTKIIAQQKEQLEAVVENMSEGVFVVDQQGKFIKANKVARDFIYLPDSITTPEDRLNHIRFSNMEGREIPFKDLPVYRVMQGEKVSETRLTMEYPEGRIYLNVSGTPTFDEDGNFLMGVFCSQNITEKVKYDELVNEQKNYLYKIIDTLDLPIMQLSYPHYTIIEINQKAYHDIYGIVECDNMKRDLIKPGESILNILPGSYVEEGIQDIREMERTKGIIRRNEFEVIKYGKKSYYDLIYQPILNVHDDITEVLMIGIDITCEVEQKKELENILKMKDEFFAFISHEFKTPLTVINSALQTMELVCKAELSEKAKGFMQKIKQNSLRQLRLVNNLLDITRAESGYIKIHKRNMDIVHLTKAITESVTQYARGKEIRLKFLSPLTGKVIAIDDEKYERILLNLLSNAIKFTPPRKTISVKVFNKKGRIYIEVKDEGVGIPKEKQEVIFDRFGQVSSSLTRKSEGTGIGLYLVKVLVNALGGDIWLSGEEDSGSTFTISFPITKVDDSKEETLKELTDNRLIQSAAIEFSDIYDK